MVGSSNTKTESAWARPISLGELEALRLAAGERERRLPQRKVAEPQVAKRLQARGNALDVAAGVERLLDAHGHELRKREAHRGAARALGRTLGSAVEYSTPPRRSGSRGTRGT